MGHSQDHSHAHDPQTYYLEQLCTIGIVGAFGAVTIMLWYQNLLSLLLVGWMHIFVMIGGATLLVLVGIRAVSLWVSVDRSAAHHHDHEHTHDGCHGHDHAHHHHHDHEHSHDCGHDHAHEHAAGHEAITAPPAPPEVAVTTTPPAHSHDSAASHEHAHDDCGHDHGWSPWRYMVLLLPVVLYFMDLPGQGFSANYAENRIANMQVEDTNLWGTDLPARSATSIALVQAPAGQGPVQAAALLVPLFYRDEKPIPLEFQDLKVAAFLPAQRALYDGKIGRLLGQYVRGATDNTCSLVRFKMQCCAADAQPLNVVIISPVKLSDVEALRQLEALPLERRWVEIEGRIQFRPRRNHAEEYLPVLQIDGPHKITPANPPKNPYI